MKELINKLTHLGDLIAILGFIFLIIYFASIANKTIFENLLLIFVIFALIAVIVFSINHYTDFFL